MSWKREPQRNDTVDFEAIVALDVMMRPNGPERLTGETRAATVRGSARVSGNVKLTPGSSVAGSNVPPTVPRPRVR